MMQLFTSRFCANTTKDAGFSRESSVAKASISDGPRASARSLAASRAAIDRWFPCVLHIKCSRSRVHAAADWVARQRYSTCDGAVPLCVSDGKLLTEDSEISQQ